MKAATIATAIFGLVMAISIHAAREGGDESALNALIVAEISIHAAREGGDRPRTKTRGAKYISIHAAREGGDLHPPTVRSAGGYFNPRRP